MQRCSNCKRRATGRFTDFGGKKVMATGMELILNLRSAREWHRALEEGAECRASTAAAEETARRLEKILAVARRDALKTASKPRRRISSPMADDLALHEGQITGAIQYLQRRQAS